MISIRDLEEKWLSISPQSGGYYQIGMEYPLSVHIGYNSIEKMTLFIYNTVNIENLKSTQSVTAECMQIEGVNALRFVLNYPSLQDLFIKLCWDLLDSSYNKKDPILALLNRFESWRRLLQQDSIRLMSPSVQKGLVAELMYFLDTLKTMDVQSVLNAWVGPEGSDQDFIFNDFWAEIKAISIDGTEVAISSLQQLDCVESGSLVIYCLDKTSTKGLNYFSLNDVIDKTRKEILDERMRNVFECKIAKCGFLEIDKEQYKHIYYRFNEKKCYEVTQAFPKLTSRSVPTEITRAKYFIDLPSIEKYRVKEDT